MKHLTPLLIIISLISCEKEDNKINVQIGDIQNYTFIDPNESSDNIPDTVHYDFKANNKMTMILYDYELKQTSVELEKIDTAQCIYYLENNSIFATYDYENFNLIHGFGLVNQEWEILELTSDTMIVDFYSINQRLRVGHAGFIVEKK